MHKINNIWEVFIHNNKQKKHCVAVFVYAYLKLVVRRECEVQNLIKIIIWKL